MESVLCDRLDWMIGGEVTCTVVRRHLEPLSLHEVDHVGEIAGHKAAIAALLKYTLLEHPTDHSADDIGRRGERGGADGTGHFDRDDTTAYHCNLAVSIFRFLGCFERAGGKKTNQRL